MNLPRKVRDRFAHLAMCGDSAAALAYLRRIVKRGVELEPYRRALLCGYSPELESATLAAFPWLGAAKFDCADARSAILEVLERVTEDGAKVADFVARCPDLGAVEGALAALKADGGIVEGTRPGPGRRATRYWLTEWAPHHIRRELRRAESASNPFTDWRADPNDQPRKRREWKRDD